MFKDQLNIQPWHMERKMGWQYGFSLYKEVACWNNGLG
jgi:hypothetical protein